MDWYNMILISIQREANHMRRSRYHVRCSRKNELAESKYNAMKGLRLSAIILLGINSIGAVAGGIRLIGDPSGKAMGWTTAMLEHSPFDDYLIPGIMLLISNGLLSLAVAFLTLKKRKHYPSFIILQGAVLCGWIITQIMLIRDYHPLHLGSMAIGLLLIICGYILSAITPLRVEKSRHF